MDPHGREEFENGSVGTGLHGISYGEAIGVGEGEAGGGSGTESGEGVGVAWGSGEIDARLGGRGREEDGGCGVR